MNRTRNSISSIKWGMCVVAFVVLISSIDAAEKVAARTVTHTGARSGSILSNEVAKVDVPASVFQDTPRRRDPFFPNAKYRKQKQVVTPIAVGGSEILNQLKLNGLGGIGAKRWAMINGVSIYLNEVSKVAVSGKYYEIECLEMSGGSVTIGIKNTTARRELKLDEK